MKKLINQPFPVLKTERLVMDQLRPEDAHQIFKYQSDKANFPFVDMPIYDSIDQAYVYIDKMNQGVLNNQWVIWTIRLNGEAIGTISLWNFNEDESACETGYGLFSHRGKGYMAEALRAVKAYGFDTIGITKLEAFTNKENVASIELLKRCGFSYGFDFLEEYTTTGVPMEMVVYKCEV